MLNRFLKPASRNLRAHQFTFQGRIEPLEDRTVPACISPDAFICTPLPPTHQGLAMHIHPRVRIILNGQEQTIPANIGISAQGYLPMHTHDASGTIHVESPVVRDFTLKNFFDTWGQVLTNQEVLGFLTEGSRPVQVTLNGQPMAPSSTQPLRDGDQIVVRADNAFPVGNLGLVARALTHSAESYGYFITQAYQRYLDRTPDQAGLQGWIARMQAGLTDEQLEASFIGSTEYIASHGGTGAAWVRGMYQDLLGRAPDQAGLQGWIERLANGVKPYDVAYGFAASAEREGMRIREDYVTLLGRQPSQPEVNGWVAQFLAGVTNESVIAGFVGSREYFYNPAKGRGDRAAWLVSAYQDVLHRTPSEAEVNNWVAVLNRW